MKTKVRKVRGKICGNCLWFKPFLTLPTMVGNEGYCKRFPPNINGTSPVTFFDNYCGEFKVL